MVNSSGYEDGMRVMFFDRSSEAWLGQAAFRSAAEVYF